MNATLTLLLLLTPAAQTPAPPPSADDALLLEGVHTIVNGEAIRAGEIDAAMTRVLAQRTITTPDEYQETYTEILGTFLREELRMQAGADMGLDPAIVGREVDGYYDRQTAQHGVLGHSELLSARGLDPQSAREDIERQFYYWHWHNAETGLDVGARGRVHRDRFVRPGELHELYLAHRERFATPASVELQHLVILDAQTGGDSEGARDYVGQYRERAVAGEGLDDLVAEVGGFLKAQAGVAPAVETDGLRPAALAEWAKTAAVGELSPVLPFVGPNDEPGFQFVRLLSRAGGTPPPGFVDAEVQERLTELRVQAWEDEMLRRADAELRQDAWLWVIGS